MLRQPPDARHSARRFRDAHPRRPGPEQAQPSNPSTRAARRLGAGMTCGSAGAAPAQGPALMPPQTGAHRPAARLRTPGTVSVSSRAPPLPFVFHARHRHAPRHLETLPRIPLDLARGPPHPSATTTNHCSPHHIPGPLLLLSISPVLPAQSSHRRPLLPLFPSPSIRLEPVAQRAQQPHSAWG